MAQGTGYTYSQRGDVVLATRTGTTRNQPSNYKPFKLLKGVDTVITFFIKDVNGCPVQLHDKSIKAQIAKHDSHGILISKNLRITDYEHGVATLHITPGDIDHLDLAFYDILLTYTSGDNKVTALHADQNYRYCYVAEIEECIAHGHMEESVGYVSALDHSDDWTLLSSTPMTADITFEGIFGIYFRGGLSVATSSLTAGFMVGCHASLNVTLSLTAGAGGGPGYVVNFVNIGIGFQVGDIIVVTGDQINGLSGISIGAGYGGGNDLTINITAVDASGGITGYTVSGTPNTNLNTYVSRAIPGPAFGNGVCHGLNTFSLHSSRLNGTFNMQATLSNTPGNTDWYNVNFPNVCGGKADISLTSGTGSNVTPMTDVHAIDGMFMYIRFKITITTGRLDKILYRR